jgi:hypothetical protein
MKKIRQNTFETNSSSTHALVILSKEDYKAWKNNEKTLNLLSGEAQELTEEDKKIIRNTDGSIDYNGEHFDSEYDFMESEYYNVIDDSNASKEYIDNYAEVEQKELGNNVIMSIYRGDRW